jgi:allantoicase
VIDVSRLTDLASRALGGSVLFANDDSFADVHALIAPGPAVHDPAAFAPRGKVYDGWETRRRREPGDDVALIRLGVPGVVRAVDVDTSFFVGNHPPAASVAIATVLGYPDADELLGARWATVIDHGPLTGGGSNLVEVGSAQLATHVRLSIHPDGGVARLRVFGDVVPDPRRLGGRVDLAALELGGAVDGCSNMFYASPANALAPGRAQVMSDGWETARRRDDGNDWLTVRLAAPGALEHIVIDTTRFVHNAPGWARVTDAETGAELLPRTRLVPDTEHRFRAVPAAAATRVRLDIYPDGGISRLRLLGTVDPAQRAAVTARWTRTLPADVAAAVDPTEFFG